MVENAFELKALWDSVPPIALVNTGGRMLPISEERKTIKQDRIEFLGKKCHLEIPLAYSTNQEQA